MGIGDLFLELDAIVQSKWLLFEKSNEIRFLTIH